MHIVLRHFLRLISFAVKYLESRGRKYSLCSWVFKILLCKIAICYFFSGYSFRVLT